MTNLKLVQEILITYAFAVVAAGFIRYLIDDLSGIGLLLKSLAIGAGLAYGFLLRRVLFKRTD